MGGAPPPSEERVHQHVLRLPGLGQHVVRDPRTPTRCRRGSLRRRERKLLAALASLLRRRLSPGGYHLRTRSRSQAATTACWRACSRRDFSRGGRWAPAGRCVSVSAAAHSGCLTDIDLGGYGAVARGESGIDEVLSSQGLPVWTLCHSGFGHYVTAIGKPHGKRRGWQLTPDAIEVFYRLKRYGQDTPKAGNRRLTAGAWTGCSW
jgi:hypothetical protein